MDGLECKEVCKSELERTLRIDSEFYSKNYVEIYNMLSSLAHKPLTAYVDVSDGNHTGISEQFSDEGIPYYRGQDAGAFFIENSNPICIDEITFNRPVMKRSHLKQGDVLLSIVGTIGALSLVYSNKDATCSCKLAILRPKKSDTEAVIAAFLKGKYGQAQIKRYTRGAVQMGLILEDTDQIIVPHFTDTLGKAIKQQIDLAYRIKEHSIQTYSEAQELLETHLGISKAEKCDLITSTETLLQSFKATGRLDAEYYQPQYRKLEMALINYDPNIKPLGVIAKYIFTGEYAEEYLDKDALPNLRNYIRGTDISNGYIESDNSIFIDPTGFSKFVSSGDILTGRVGTIGKFGVVDETLSGALCSDNILCFHLPEAYMPNVYALYFNNPIIKSLITRLARGSVQQRLNQETLREVLVPYINDSVQTLIDQKVASSFNLREKSEHILAIVIRTVEMAIEQGEDAALAWLKERSGE